MEQDSRAASGRTPLVGVFPRGEERANGSGRAFLVQSCLAEGLQRAGAASCVLTPTDDPAVLQAYLAMFDGFVLPGGGDIRPERYGEERLPPCGPGDPVRDAFELALVPSILASGKPLLGICRGNQLLNVACGGTLWQDIPSQPESRPVPVAAPITHNHKEGEGFGLLEHTVAVRPGTLLARVLEPALAASGTSASALPVNSLHHQSVHRLGTGLTVGAYAPDGTVEALEMPNRDFVLSVQWHPEFLWEHDAASMAIFQAFVDACRRVGQAG